MIIWNPVCREDSWSESLIPKRVLELLYHLYNGCSSFPFLLFKKKRKPRVYFHKVNSCTVFQQYSKHTSVWEDQLNRQGMIQFTTSLSSIIIHSFMFSAQPSAYFRHPRVSRTSISDQKGWHGVCMQREPFQRVSWRLGKMESEECKPEVTSVCPTS